MSANRANASARNRRAGGAEIAPPQQNIRPGQPGQPGRGQPQQQQMSNKPQISISDAIGLVSLRIGRLEQFMFKINNEGITNPDDLNLGENDRIIDEDVFRSIVSRIEQIEHNIAVSTQTSNSSNQQPVNIENHPLIKTLNDKITAQQLSIYELKDMILKMQTFAIETSTSLKAMIEQYESDKAYLSQENFINDLNDQLNNGFEPSEVIEDNQLTIDGESLKELIKKELSEE
jgi:hypothetical protein